MKAIGFDYQFNAIQNESNELFLAYKEMFEIAVSQQGGGVWELLLMYAPILDRILVREHPCTQRSCLTSLWMKPGERYGVIKKSQATIQRVAGQLIQEKKRKIQEAEKSGSAYIGKDLLSALRECSTHCTLCIF